MNVLIADKVSGKTITDLQQLGAEVIFNPELVADELPQHIKGVDVVIVRSTKVTATTIAAADKLSLIIRAGAGFNTIDLKAAGKRAIHVANCPGKNTQAVAELALGLLIAADREIANATADLRTGKWEKKKYGNATGLKGRTLGIVGVGAIGIALAQRAVGLEMNVVGWSRSLTPEKAEKLGIGYCSDMFELAARSDAVSIHLAATPETKHLIDASFLDKMKRGAILVNTSRGEVVDTIALKQSIMKKQLRVGLDVYENEPAGGKAEFTDTELASMVTCTPHIGASTNQAAEAVANETVAIVKHYLQKGKPLNGVNLRSKTSTQYELIIRHFNEVGVLSGVLDRLKEANINIEEMENLIFEGSETASCVLMLDKQPNPETLKNIENTSEVIQAQFMLNKA